MTSTGRNRNTDLGEIEQLTRVGWDTVDEKKVRRALADLITEVRELRAENERLWKHHDVVEGALV